MGSRPRLLRSSLIIVSACLGLEAPSALAGMAELFAAEEGVIRGLLTLNGRGQAETGPSVSLSRRKQLYVPPIRVPAHGLPEVAEARASAKLATKGAVIHPPAHQCRNPFCLHDYRTESAR